jgi:hypothetical protein
MKLVSSKTLLLINWIRWNECGLSQVEGKTWNRDNGLVRMIELKLLEKTFINGLRWYSRTDLYYKIEQEYSSLIYK